MSNDNQVKIDITADVQGFKANMAEAQAHLDRVAQAFDKGGAATREYTKHSEAAEGMTNKMSAATSNLTGLLKQAAAAFGLYKIAEYVKDAALLNARYETLGISMIIVGKNAGYNAAQMDDAALSMQKTGISMVESRQQAMRLVQAHIDLTQSTKLARIAQDAAVIGNMNSSEAFAHMIHGIQTGQTDVLRTIGLNISMEQSYNLMAQQLHKNADALSQNEKTQAILNAVLLAGTEIAGTYEAAMGTAGKQLNSMTRYLEDLKVKQGEVFNEVLTVAVMAFTDHLKDANGELDEMAKNNQIKEWGNAVTDIFVGVADNINNAVGAAQILGKTLGLLAVYASVGAISKEGRAATAAYSEDISSILDSEDRFSKALIERRAATAEKQAADRAKKRDSDLKSTADYMAKVEALDSKYFASRTMTAKQYDAEMSKLANGDKHKYADPASTKNTVDAYKSIKKHADDFILSLQKEAAQLGLSADQKMMMDAATVALTLHTDKERMAHMTNAAAAIHQTAAFAASTEAAKFQAEGLKRLAKEEETRVKALNDSVDADQKTLDSMTRKNDLLEMGIESVTAMAVAELEAKLASVDYTQATYEEVAALEKRLDIAKQIAVQAGRGESIKAERDAIKQMDADFKKSVDGYDDVFRKGFSSMLNRGTGLWESFTTSLTTTWETSVADQIYKTFAQPFVVKFIASMLGIVGGGGLSGVANAANGASGGGNWMTMASNAKTAYGAATGDGGWFSNSWGSNLTQSSYGSQAGLSTEYMVDGVGTGQYANTALGSDVAGYANTAGQVIGYASALYSASEGKWGEAIGTAVGTYFFGPLGAAIGGWLGGWVDEYFGGGGGPKVEGASTRGVNADGSLSDFSVGMGGDRSGIGYSNNAGINQVLGIALQDLSTFVEKLGGSAEGINASLSYITDPQGDSPDMVSSSLTDASGKQIYKHSDDNLARDSYKTSLELESKRLLLAGVQASEGLDKIFHAIVAGIGDIGTASAEIIDAALSHITEAAAVLGYGDADPLAAVMLQIERDATTVHGAWQINTSALNTMIAAYDGTAAATHNLAAATQNQYQIELQLIGQIQSALVSTHAMFSNSSEVIRLSVMSDAQKYDYNRSQADLYYAQLMTETDPSKIAYDAQQIDKYANAAYGLLSPEQQLAANPEFLSYFEKADQLTNERLESAQAQVLQNHKDIGETIKVAMDAVADRLIEAAAALIVAAETPPAPAAVTVDIRSNAQVDVEVSLG